MKNSILTIYSDGGARGNPGPAACAFVVEENGKTIFKKAKFLGRATNNVAEYLGVMEALKWLLENKNTVSCQIVLKLDSQLVVRQLTGVYKIKKEHLKDLFIKIKSMERKLPQLEYLYIPRSQNKLADSLLNKELDKKS